VGELTSCDRLNVSSNAAKSSLTQSHVEPGQLTSPHSTMLSVQSVPNVAITSASSLTNVATDDEGGR
jgi:hypothetical protein